MERRLRPRKLLPLLFFCRVTRRLSNFQGLERGFSFLAVDWVSCKCMHPEMSFGGRRKKQSGGRAKTSISDFDPKKNRANFVVFPEFREIA